MNTDRTELFVFITTVRVFLHLITALIFKLNITRILALNICVVIIEYLA